jgi:hypothetical protein
MSSNSITHQEWIDLCHDASIFPALTGAIYGIDLRFPQPPPDKFCGLCGVFVPFWSVHRDEPCNGEDAELDSQDENPKPKPPVGQFNSMHVADMAPSVPRALTKKNLAALNAERPEKSLSTIFLRDDARPDAPVPKINGLLIWEYLATLVPPPNATAAQRGEMLWRRWAVIERAMPCLWNALRTTTTAKPHEGSYIRATEISQKIQAAMTSEEQMYVTGKLNHFLIEVADVSGWAPRTEED